MAVGEWGKNIAVAAVLTGGIGLIGLGLDAEFKHKLWNNIKESVDSLANSYSVSSAHGGGSVYQPAATNVGMTSDAAQSSKFCMGCGKRIPTEAHFCPMCGSSQPV